jgi:hypothetical protein
MIDWQRLAEHLGHPTPAAMFSQLYVHDGSTIREVADYLGCDSKATRREMVRCGTPIRHRPTPKSRLEVWLRTNEARAQGMTSAEIQQEVGYASRHAMITCLRRLGVEYRRTQGLRALRNR